VSGAEETPAAGEVVPPQPVFAFCGIGIRMRFSATYKTGELKLSAEKVFRDITPIQRMT